MPVPLVLFGPDFFFLSQRTAENKRDNLKEVINQCSVAPLIAWQRLTTHVRISCF